jgi:gliding motility-associated protein GldM
MTIKKRPVSPRQKMINLMYVVLMAMLALNVSTEVLDGFSLIEDSLKRTTQSVARKNQLMYNSFDEQMQTNPAKTREWYEKALEVRRLSDSLYVFTETLKNAIVKEADGEKGDVDYIRDKEDLEAASQVMLSPSRGKGEQLYHAINSFRTKMLTMVNDDQKKQIISVNLSTDVPSEANGKNWQEYMFESKPTVAAVTMLTKLQSDIRYAEGEVLHTLMANIDENDVRVNALNAFVIPNAQTIVRGNRFKANIVMAAVDTTHIPEVYIGGEKVTLNNGIYETVCSRTGDFTLSGWLQTETSTGEQIRREFLQKYSVIEPTATVSADMMNVLYAGYDNPISISVPGAPLTSISATMTGGSLKQTAPGKYVARPSKIGQDAVVTVFSGNNGQKQQMAQYTFRVRKLPEPTPFIAIKDENGNADHYSGGNITKSKLLAANRIGAAVDDGILHIPFRVLSFEIVLFDNMGNAVPLVSNGADFSTQQKDALKSLTRGRRLYISHLTAIGPDGIERKLNTSMEVIIR